MKSEINKIFSKSSCLSIDEMFEYLSGTLPDTDKRRIEMHTADCEMCNDELEGLSNMNKPDNLSAIVHSINTNIDNYIQTNKTGTVKSSEKYNIKKIFAVAASVLLLISAGFLLEYYMNTNTDSLADMQKSENADIAEESSIITEKESVIDEYEEIETESISVENEDFEPAVYEPTGENIIDEITISETDKNTEELSFDDDDADIILYEEEAVEAIEDIVVNKNISENKKMSSTRSEVSASEDEGATDGEKNDSFAGFATRHVPNKNNRAKKEETIKYNSIRSSALFSYNEKVYNEASDGFKKYLKYKPNDQEIIYKYGISLYYTKNYNDALKNFDKIISFNNNKYFEDAEWYKTQTLVKSGKNKEAVDLLKKIVSQNGKYKNKASDVLKQLD